LFALRRPKPKFVCPGRHSDADHSASKPFDNISFPMPTTATVFVEFRCTRCWYSNCADSESVGSQVDCRNCGERLEVPEATPDRIERALALLESEPELLAPRSTDRKQTLDFDRQYSAREVNEIARKASHVPLNQMNFQGYGLASAWTRLFAQIIDAVAFCVCAVLGFMLYLWLAKQGLPIEDPIAAVKRGDDLSLVTMVSLCIAPGMLQLLQWTLLTFSGQTIGKKILMMRVVTDQGELPGFVRVILIREWASYLLCIVPWAGPWYRFLDPLFIFSGSRKCLHDHIAGTRVVSLV
jgi:uncharacterized RDD family membrane protein YckC/DNA-directed RNA polymerase subunit RPC12/RpoP